MKAPPQISCLLESRQKGWWTETQRGTECYLSAFSEQIPQAAVCMAWHGRRVLLLLSYRLCRWAASMT